MPPHREFEPLRNLEKQIEFMIQGHQLIIDILNTPNLPNIIEGFREPGLRKTASGDPLQTIRDAGVVLPASGVSVQIHEFPRNWEVEIQVEQGNSLVIMGFNSRKGFFVR